MKLSNFEMFIIGIVSLIFIIFGILTSWQLAVISFIFFNFLCLLMYLALKLYDKFTFNKLIKKYENEQAGTGKVGNGTIEGTELEPPINYSGKRPRTSECNSNIGNGKPENRNGKVKGRDKSSGFTPIK
jgi:hypothetical protein